MVDLIERTENSSSDFWQGVLSDTTVDNNTVILAFADENAGEYKEQGYRISPYIRFKYVGTVEVSLAKTAETPDGTIIKLEISIDGGDTWESVWQGGSIAIDSNTPTVIEMKAKQILFTNLEQFDDESLNGSYEIPSSDLNEEDDISKVFEDILGITFLRNNTVTPQLDVVTTEISLVDGNLRQLGMLLFRGKVWDQDIEDSYE